MPCLTLPIYSLSYSSISGQISKELADLNPKHIQFWSTHWELPMSRMLNEVLVPANQEGRREGIQIGKPRPARFSVNKRVVWCPSVEWQLVTARTQNYQLNLCLHAMCSLVCYLETKQSASNFSHATLL